MVGRGVSYDRKKVDFIIMLPEGHTESIARLWAFTASVRVRNKEDPKLSLVMY